MAEIVAVARFSLPGGNTFSSYLNYIDRDEAILHDKSSLDSMYSGYMDYMDDDAKVIAGDQLEPGSRRALFTTWKDNLTGKEKTDIKKAFRNAQDAGSNLWQVVISFENQYLENCGLYDPATKHLNEALVKQAGRRAIDTMLRAEHMENAFWTAAIHHNTDNFHIHVAIVEPTPMREQKEYTIYRRNQDGSIARGEDGRKIPELDEYGNPVTRLGYKGTIRQKSLGLLKSTFRAELEDNREIYASITSILRETILLDKKSRSLLKTPEFTRGMMALYERLKETGVERKYWNYNRNLISSCKGQIDALSDFFLQTYHQADYEQFLKDLEREQRRQSRFYGYSDYRDNILYGKEGLYARLGNAILRELQEYDRAVTGQEARMRSATRAPGTTALRSPDASRGICRGLSILEYNLQINYDKARNLREAERLQEEIARRGDRGFEI